MVSVEICLERKIRRKKFGWVGKNGPFSSEPIICVHLIKVKWFKKKKLLIFYAHIHQVMKQLVFNKNNFFLIICPALRFMPYLVGIIYNDCVLGGWEVLGWVRFLRDCCWIMGIVSWLHLSDRKQNENERYRFPVWYTPDLRDSDYWNAKEFIGNFHMHTKKAHKHIALAWVWRKKKREK